MSDLRQQTIGQFLDELASGSATPGGGAAAGLAGAMGAALMSMVANLTIGRKKYAGYEEEMRQLQARADEVRREMTNLAQRDALVFDSVMAAYKLPKDTEAQRAAREASIQRALAEATQVPLQTMEQAAAIYELAVPLSQKGNTTAISDVGAGLLLAEAALHAAMLNVKINLGLMTDQEFSDQVRRRADALLAGKDEARRTVIAAVEARI
ncbi:MAG: cyclodeaminase/cyclohydrolase family protein [Ardenticatenaceae bacterium]|nr:cyclodeaminase/cyclohydrolase family protein [Ardenticatenaceae bacterium]